LGDHGQDLKIWLVDQALQTGNRKGGSTEKDKPHGDRKNKTVGGAIDAEPNASQTP
jgi:hypothetical protein